MFAISWNFPFRKRDGSISTIGDEMGSGGSAYTLPTASTETKGGVKVGAGLTMDGEVLKNANPTAYTLPTASASTLGGVKVGDGLSIEDGVLSVSGGSGGSGGIKVYTWQNNSSVSTGNDTYLAGDTMAHFGMETGDELIAVVSANGAFKNIRITNVTNQAGTKYSDLTPATTVYLYADVKYAVDVSSSRGYINFIYKTL